MRSEQKGVTVMARREPKLRGGGMFYYWMEVDSEEIFMFSPIPIKCVRITFEKEAEPPRVVLGGI